MVFKGFFLLGILLAVGQASEDFQKCIDSCTQTLEDKVTDELEDCKGKCQGIIRPVTHSFGIQSMLNGLLNDDIFREVDDSHRHGGLTLSFGFPNENEEWGMPKWVHQHVGNMMHQMNQQMGQMMQSMKTGMSDMMTGGKMHVMKSGPGFYEEKTYNIGPNGKMTLIQNDEIDKANELEENDVDEHDVEVFDPNMLLREFEQVVHDDATKNEKEEKDWIQEMDKQLAKQIINDFNEFNNVEEGPKLPETGLRSRQDNHLCRMEGLQWSEWSKCLHLNMAMPKWLVISSLSLGILFLIWLCLVIPSNAPKQRVKKPITNAKEVEAFTIVTEKLPPVNQPTNDLPPPYEDVANIKVALEPESTKNNEV